MHCTHGMVLLRMPGCCCDDMPETTLCAYIGAIGLHHGRSNHACVLAKHQLCNRMGSASAFFRRRPPYDVFQLQLQIIACAVTGHCAFRPLPSAHVHVVCFHITWCMHFPSRVGSFQWFVCQPSPQNLPFSQERLLFVKLEHVAWHHPNQSACKSAGRPLIACSAC